MVTPSLLAAVQSPQVSVMTANLHLFGRLARVGDPSQETPLYYKDFKRLEATIGYLRDCRPHLVALQEVWDPVFQHRFARELHDIYPYHVFTPWAGGIPEAIEAISETIPMDPGPLEEGTSRLVRRLAQNHYQVTHSFLYRMAGRLFPEDLAARFLQRLFPIRDLWGAGLLFLSQYPIDRLETGFKPHPVKADLERFANKGTLKVRVDLPEIGPVFVLLTHLQEGESRKAIAAREEQLRAIRATIDTSDFPVIVLGDFNIERDQPVRRAGERRRLLRRTEEFQTMTGILNLRDAYSHRWHSLLHERPGHTFIHGPYSSRIGIPPQRQDPQVLDYIFYDRNFTPLAVEVDETGFFLDPEHQIPLSDHRPVFAVLAKKPR